MLCPLALGRTCTPAGCYTGRSHACKPVLASTCTAHICTHAPSELRSPLAGARHTCAPQEGPCTHAHGPTPKTGGRSGAGGGLASESGEPPPRGDPASLGCGQRVSQAVARKPQGRPVPAGRVQGPAAPPRPPPPRPSPPPPPHLRPGSPRERGPEGGPRAPAGAAPHRPLAGSGARALPELRGAPGPREPRSSGKVGAAARPLPASLLWSLE